MTYESIETQRDEIHGGIVGGLYALASLLYAETPDSGGESSEGGGEDSDGNTKTGDDDVPFSDAQQKQVNTIIAQRLSRQKREFDEAKAKLAEYEAAEAKRAEDEEKRRQQEMEEKGEFQKLLEEKEKKFQTETAALKSTIRQLEADKENILTETSINSAIRNVKGANPRLMDHAKRDLQEGVMLPDTDTYLKVKSQKGDNGQVEIVVVGLHDARIPNSKGEFMSVSEAAQRYYDAFPELIFADNRGGSGSIGNSGGNAAKQAELQAALAKAQKSGSTADILNARRLQREMEARN